MGRRRILHCRLIRSLILCMPKYTKWREEQTFCNRPLSTLLWKLILRQYFWNYPYPYFLLFPALDNNSLHIPKRAKFHPQTVHSEIWVNYQERTEHRDHTFKVVLLKKYILFLKVNASHHKVKKSRFGYDIVVIISCSPYRRQGKPRGLLQVLW